MNVKQLFWDFYKAPVENKVEKILERYSLLNSPANWRPYGGKMHHDIVVRPLVNDESLSAVYINMDRKVWLSHRTKLAKEEAITVAGKRYVPTVYFHTLFLCTITKNRKYGIVGQREPEGERDVDVTEYIADLFQTFYAQFLLNFDTQELVAALEA